MVRRPQLVTAEVERPRREATVFVALTFAIAGSVYLPLFASGQGWIPVELPAVLAAVGVASPGLATLVLRVRDEGSAGVRTFLGGLTDWRFGRSWWALTIALPPLYFLTTSAVYIGLGGTYTIDPVGRLVEAGPAIVALILLTAALAFGEEVGWRGYLLPRLQSRMGAMTASLLLGVVWFVWHLPLFLQGAPLDWPILVRGVFIVSGAVVYTWLFNNTGGSVLAVTLFHAGLNIWGRLLGAHPMLTGDAVSGYVLAGGNVAMALVVLVLFGHRTLTDRDRLRF